MKQFSDYFDVEEREYIKAVLHVKDDNFNALGEMIQKGIASTLGSDEADDFRLIREGVTNINFQFSLGDNLYVYRCPGFGTEQFISRESEAFGNAAGHRLKLDPSYIYIDVKEGWKISRFIPFTRKLDYYNNGDVDKALDIMRTLHKSGENAPRDFLLWEETDKAYWDILEYGGSRYTDFKAVHKKVSHLAELSKQDNMPIVLTHGDCWQPNFLVTEEEGEEKIHLIDWEFSGNCDAGSDLGTFICCSDYNLSEAVDVIQKYYYGNATKVELRHMLAYTSFTSYYWFIYMVHLAKRGTEDIKLEEHWYNNAKSFADGALPYYLDNK